MSGGPVAPARPDASRTHLVRGRLLVFAATALWGASAALARFAFHRRHAPVLAVVELRLMVSVALLAPYLAFRRPALLRVERRDIPYLLILGLVGVAWVQGSYYRSIAVLGVGLSILLQYVAPVLIVLFDALRGRPVRGAMWIAVIAALAGTALVIGDVDRSAIHASLLDWLVGFSSAVSFAFYIVFSKRGLARYAPETVLLYTFAIAATFWACIMPPWKILTAGFDAQMWCMFVAIGVFSTLLPFRLFYSGLRHLPAAEAGAVATLEPVVAVFATAVVMGEWLRPLQWIGAALVLAGAAMTSLRVPEALPAQAERG